MKLVSKSSASITRLVGKTNPGGWLYKKGGDSDWIKKAVNPKHKGYCTPMTKSTCTPKRKALAMTFKKHHGFHKKFGTGGKASLYDLLGNAFNKLIKKTPEIKAPQLKQEIIKEIPKVTPKLLSDLEEDTLLGKLKTPTVSKPLAITEEMIPELYEKKQIAHFLNPSLKKLDEENKRINRHRGLDDFISMLHPDVIEENEKTLHNFIKKNPEIHEPMANVFLRDIHGTKALNKFNSERIAQGKQVPDFNLYNIHIPQDNDLEVNSFLLNPHHVIGRLNYLNYLNPHEDVVKYLPQVVDSKINSFFLRDSPYLNKERINYPYGESLYRATGGAHKGYAENNLRDVYNKPISYSPLLTSKFFSTTNFNDNMERRAKTLWDKLLEKDLAQDLGNKRMQHDPFKDYDMTGYLTMKKKGGLIKKRK